MSGGTADRFKREARLAAGLEHLTVAGDDRSGLKDLLWALVNTKEFLLNH